MLENQNVSIGKPWKEVQSSKEVSMVHLLSAKQVLSQRIPSKLYFATFDNLTKLFDKSNVT